MKVQTYGEGGYDAAKPNNNVVDETDAPDRPADGLVSARAVLEQALDPGKPNPTTTARLDAIEQLLAAQVAPDLLPPSAPA